MSKKIYQVVIYKSISDEEKLAKYAALAGPAIIGAGGKFLARGIPVMTKEMVGAYPSHRKRMPTCSKLT